MFHNMEYVYCVYKEKSFSKAAEILHISQPSLSAAIKKTEETVGTPIFERKTRPVSLTPFGVEFIQGIEQIYGIEEHLHNIVYELSTLQRGYIAVGGSNLSIPFLVPETIAAFKRQYPQVTVRIVEDSTDRLKALLDNGELNFMITNRPLPREEYERRLCYRENLVLAVPKECPVNECLAKKRLRRKDMGAAIFRLPGERGVDLAEVADVPFILLSRGNYLRSCSDHLFEEGGVVPKIILEVEKSAVAYNFANFGLGATILSSVLVEKLQEESRLCFYKLNGPYAVREAFLCSRRGGFIPTAVQYLMDMLAEGQAVQTAGHLKMENREDI